MTKTTRTTDSSAEKPVFPAAMPLADLLREKQVDYDEICRAEPHLAKHYISPQAYYPRLYKEAQDRLACDDILTLQEAAGKMRIRPEALQRKAARGAVVLIDIEGAQFVPAWSLDSRGRPKKLALAIAREFEEGAQHGFFKFMDYIKFMSSETLKLSVKEISPRSMREAFRAAGVKQGQVHMEVHVPMHEVADRALANRPLLMGLVNKLGAAVTRVAGMGGPNEGGLSPEFLQEFVPLDMPDRLSWSRYTPGQ